jgi:hypothetical protein
MIEDLLYEDIVDNNKKALDKTDIRANVLNRYIDMQVGYFIYYFKLKDKQLKARDSAIVDFFKYHYGKIQFTINTLQDVLLNDLGYTHDEVENALDKAIQIRVLSKKDTDIDIVDDEKALLAEIRPIYQNLKSEISYLYDKHMLVTTGDDGNMRIHIE